MRVLAKKCHEAEISCDVTMGKLSAKLDDKPYADSRDAHKPGLDELAKGLYIISGIFKQ